MLLTQTPIGLIQVSEWEEKELILLSDEELLQRALAENKNFVISPATYAMVEKRQLGRVLQNMINPEVGLGHHLINTLQIIK